MEGEFSSRIRFALMLFVLILLPITSANPSGLAYMDSTWSTNDADDGDVIALNPNNTILASAHGDSVFLYNTTTLEKIGTFSIERVAALEFSPNGGLLAVNKGTSVQDRESIKLIDIHNQSILEIGALADDKARIMAWSPSGDVIAAPGPEGDAELYRASDLSVKSTLSEVHNVDVTCIDYRDDGEYILTGDESGRYAIWNSQGSIQGDYREFGESLIDCKFTPDGLDYILLGDEGKVESRTFDGFDKTLSVVDGAQKILLSKSGTRMHIVVNSDSFRGLVTYEYDNFVEAKRTTFFHKSEDVEFAEDEYSRIQALFVAGGTGQIAVYLREKIPYGFNQPGADLDGDLIPDDLDSDDDGDGITDDWDEDIGCDAPEGILCSRYPDLNKIRNVNIDIGGQFVITDSITLPPEESSNIRNLSRISIARDQILSKHETELFADAVCANIDHGDLIEQWSDSIKLSNGELGEATVSCKVENGMELVQSADSTTQISFSIVTSFTYESKVIFPVEVSLTDQTLPTDGSISWLAPAHPISLQMGGDGAVSQEIALWRNDGEEFAPITLEKLIIPEPTFMEKLLDLALTPIAFIGYIGIIATGMLLFVRRGNKIDIDLEDDEPEGENENPEDEYNEEVISEKMDFVESEQQMERRIPLTEDFSSRKTKDTKQVPKRRKASKTKELNKAGPITKTKRTRLVSEIKEKSVIKKKAVVNSDENTVKTRKVKQNVEPEDNKVIAKRKAVKKAVVDDLEITKKRKAVKRKKKSSQKKVIDEESLQDNLATDFLNDD